MSRLLEKSKWTLLLRGTNKTCLKSLGMHGPHIRCVNMVPVLGGGNDLVEFVGQSHILTDDMLDNFVWLGIY